MNFFELNSRSNFSFLQGASHPSELVAQAALLGYAGICVADECSMAGIVRAHVEAKKQGLKLLLGSRILFTGNFDKPAAGQLTDGQLNDGQLNDGQIKAGDNQDDKQSQAIQLELLLLCPCREAYAELCTLITQARRRAVKGKYDARLKDIKQLTSRCLAVWLPSDNPPETSKTWQKHLSLLLPLFPRRLWIGYARLLHSDDFSRYQKLLQLARRFNLPMVAQNQVLMHRADRLKLQHCLTAIRLNQRLDSLGSQLISNAEQHLRSLKKLTQLYPLSLLEETRKIADLCHFSLDELRYEYPDEVLPKGLKADFYLRQLVYEGAAKRWPQGINDKLKKQLEHELKIIGELSYEHYFLTVYDLVHFARSRQILCQGRGSAANSAVCYCLFITQVDPAQSELLFERFISKERDEPPDIDVDFEHQRREEVIQYIYKKYTRGRAALAATLVTYRLKSAIRDLGKALGIEAPALEQLSRSLAWWDKPDKIAHFFDGKRWSIAGLKGEDFYQLVICLLGFPRHLSQHVGGFIITRSAMSRLVPVENASMAERTVIQWDKYDIEALKLLKIDVLALGMLTMLRKCLALTAGYSNIQSLADIPAEDPATYQMLCRGDSVGVFQIESRAQMSMLPRLKPQCFYDLVIQIAIVRPGPIQGKMVHPFLKRRSGEEPENYPNPAVEAVLKRTLGVPIFQEQVIKLAMVAAGFSGGQADQLRRAMASWGRNGDLASFKDKLLQGMLQRGYSVEFGERLFEQIKGFGSYGFPESHSASFAILAYFSAWLKCHHSAAFYCALLNSQPMGFYTSSQLLQDARAHGLTILPVDIEQSEWQSSLVFSASSAQSSDPIGLRLGLHLIKGFSQSGAKRLLKAREKHTFSSIADLVSRARLNAGEREVLVAANAMPALASDRHQGHWQSLGVEAEKPLLRFLDAHSPTLTASAKLLKAPTQVEEMVADYDALGLSLNHHPINLLRNQGKLIGCKQASQLTSMRHGQFIKVAGVVTCRQRPGTAAGVLFLTLEDETGNMNIVVWKNTLETFRRPLLASRLLLIKGRVEREKQVIHIIAGYIEDISEKLPEFKKGSRDFH